MIGRVPLVWLTVALAALGEASAEGSDWPRFLGPALNGKSTETGISRPWPAAGPPIVWQMEIGDGYSMPSVADGRLFLFDRHGDKERLTALDSRSGRELWRSETPCAYEDYYDYSTGPRASPVVDGDRVYSFGVEGLLRALRAADGKLLWEVDTSERYGVVKNFFGVGSTPVVEGDLLIVQVGGSPPGTPPIHSGKVEPAGSGIVAFDKLTGEVRYAVADELASYASPVVTTIGDRRWGFLLARGGLIGFEPGSGKIEFHFPWRAQILESVNAATPVVVGDSVLVTETYGPGGALLKVRPGGYEVIWRDPPKRGQSLASHWSTPIHHDGYVYASSGRNRGDAELRAIDLATGEVRWSEPRLGRSTLLYVDGHFVVLTEGGRLLLIEADPERFSVVSDATLENADGKPLLDFPAWNAPILAHGILYVRGKNRLVALELVPSS
jgi:outer membrane protein assembly factor BamB